MKYGDAVLTRPCVGVTEPFLHAGIESRIVLLNPEGTVEAMSKGLCRRVMLAYLMLVGFEYERKDL
jgi:hypothetical protein